METPFVCDIFDFHQDLKENYKIFFLIDGAARLDPAFPGVSGDFERVFFDYGIRDRYLIADRTRQLWRTHRNAKHGGLPAYCELDDMGNLAALTGPMLLPFTSRRGQYS